MVGTGPLPQPAERQPDARLLTFLTGRRGLEIHQPMIPQSHHLRTGGPQARRFTAFHQS